MHEMKDRQEQAPGSGVERVVIAGLGEEQEFSTRRTRYGSRPVKSRGLCAQCVHAETCTFSKPKDRPVLFCDEFEGEVQRPATAVATKPAPAEKVALESGAGDVGASQLKGLCRLCVKRATCTFPKPAGGVWHCEEYE